MNLVKKYMMAALVAETVTRGLHAGKIPALVNP